MLSRATLKTPIGTLYLLAHDEMLLASGFSSFAKLQDQLENIDQERSTTTVKRIPIVSELLNDYFDGDLKALDGKIGRAHV